jgi:T5SS/PEP-CTERM-associated repeat protein
MSSMLYSSMAPVDCHRPLGVVGCTSRQRFVRPDRHDQLEQQNWRQPNPAIGNATGFSVTLNVNVGTFHLTSQAPSYVGREGTGALNIKRGAVVKASLHKPHPRQGSTARRHADLPNAKSRPNIPWLSTNQPTAWFLRMPTPWMLHLSEFNPPAYGRRERCV